LGCIPGLKPLVSLGRTAGDGDWSTVHVELAVTDSVNPAPSKSCFTGWDIVWNLEAVLGGTNLVRVIAIVSIDIGHRTASDYRVDDFENAILGGCRVVSD
jgi:hypothetical protein